MFFFPNIYLVLLYIIFHYMNGSIMKSWRFSLARWTPWGRTGRSLTCVSLCATAAPASHRLGRRLVGAVGVLRPLQLHLESLHADLEAVHGLDGGLGAAGVVEADEACRREGEREKPQRRGLDAGRAGTVLGGRGHRWMGNEFDEAVFWSARDDSTTI